ncbi:hypothetical protein ACSSS7_003424 [Eimeria intestinalis]
MVKKPGLLNSPSVAPVLSRAALKDEGFRLLSFGLTCIRPLLLHSNLPCNRGSASACKLPLSLQATICCLIRPVTPREGNDTQMQVKRMCALLFLVLIAADTSGFSSDVPAALEPQADPTLGEAAAPPKEGDAAEDTLSQATTSARESSEFSTTSRTDEEELLGPPTGDDTEATINGMRMHCLHNPNILPTATAAAAAAVPGAPAGAGAACEWATGL